MRKGQSILEYTLLTACFIAAVVAMQIYVKRGMEGKWRQNMDEFGTQYSAEHTSADILIRQNSVIKTTVETKDREDGKLTSVTTTELGSAAEPNRDVRSGWEVVNTPSTEAPLFQP